MFEVMPIRVNELSHISGFTASKLSKTLKKYESGVYTRGNRVTGISPQVTEEILTSKEELEGLSDSLLLVVGNNAGGVGKTSASISLAVAYRRLVSNDKAVILIDGDSQASTTDQILGDIPDEVGVLHDYLAGNCEFDDIFTPIGEEEDNFWLVRSNLENLYLEKDLSAGAKIRDGMKSVYSKMISKFGEGTKIIVDTPPQLSALATSSICAMGRMNINSSYLIPMRTDRVSQKGAKICINEIQNVIDTYKGIEPINTYCFLSSYDQRLKVSVDTMRQVLEDDVLKDHILNNVIRHSSEMTKSSMENRNIYSTRKKHGVAEDYLDLAVALIREDH